jgi:cytochrome c
VCLSSAALLLLSEAGDPSDLSRKEGQGRGILVFSKTAGFRHSSIPDAVAAVQRLGLENGFSVDSTENDSLFTDERLAGYDAVLFLLTTGDVLDDAEQSAFRRYIESGHGFVGVHSAADTEHDWAWYGGLVGAFLSAHPAEQSAVVLVNDRVHPSTRGLPAVWRRTDEWYNFSVSPRPRVNVLATVDETTYSGGAMGTDHPIAWYQFYDGGRSWYTAMGHRRDAYADPLFLQHLLGGIRFAAGYPDPVEPVGTRSPRPLSPP